MSETSPQVEPTVAEVEGSERPDMPSVPVQVEGPVRVQLLPATTWRVSHFAPTDTNPVQLAQSDPRRLRAVVTVTTQAAWLGPTQQLAQSGRGYRMGAAATSVIEFRHREAIWASADTVGSLISISEEFWTD